MLALTEEAIQHCIERTRPFVQSSDKKSAFTEEKTAPTDIAIDTFVNYKVMISKRKLNNINAKDPQNAFKKSLDQPFSGEDVMQFFKSIPDTEKLQKQACTRY